MRKSWLEHIEFEKLASAKENVEKTRRYFQWALDKHGQLITQREFSFALEIGIGVAGGYIGLMPNLKNKISLDPIYGDVRVVAEDMPFADNLFDLVIISNALDHCMLPTEVIKEINRVLVPGGYIFLFNFLHEDENHPHSFETPQEIKDLFSGFQVKYWHEHPKTERNEFVIAVFEK